MLDTGYFLERFLQQQRFKRAQPYLQGDVLDFGGNTGELKPYVSGNYTVVNEDHAPLDEGTYHTIVCLATIEHLSKEEVFRVFSRFNQRLHVNGRIMLTTPAPRAKPILNVLSALYLLDRKNIAEHRHYWTKAELQQLATATGFSVECYHTFQLGCNQLVVMKRINDVH